jgi:glutaredoxin
MAFCGVARNRKYFQKSMKPRVVLFTQPDCPPCHIVKILLAERGVAFEERDITLDPAAVRDLTEKYNSHSTPTFHSDADHRRGSDDRVQS